MPGEPPPGAGAAAGPAGTSRPAGSAGNTPPAAAVGYLHSVLTGGTVDGPGIRYVAFLQGCPLRCLYCHNPDSWRSRTGKVTSPAELVADVQRYRRFLRQGGLTLSGGEPLFQAEFVRQVLELCRQAGIHTAIDTSGAIPLARCQAAVDLADLVILDIKALDPGLCKRLTGQTNRQALALLEHCEATGQAVWIRHVVVPGWTDDPAALEALAAFLVPWRCIQRVELLPFHQMAAYKWEALRRDYALKDCQVPSPADMDRALEPFRRRGLPLP